MPEAVVIAIVGAESTGKTALAQALAGQLAHDTGARCTWVPEVLRQWCDAQGRTPRQHEQRLIADAQTARIDEASQAHDIVVCDTTALMTAVYSHIVFGDDSLDALAVAAHRRCRLTLLTALDLPWQADGLQRDGPHVREPVDNQLRGLLAGHGLAWSVVAGSGPARLSAALSACHPVLAGTTEPDAEAPGSGLFTRLGPASNPVARPWRCERCSDPRCEHLLLRGGSASG